MAQISPGVQRLLRRDAEQLKAYAAPAPLEDFARSLGVQPEDVLKLDQNENPYGCSPRVRERLQAYNWYHVYPDPLHRQLRERLEGYTGLPAEQIIVGNGSDELIELVLRMFIEPGDQVISVGPTFAYYATAAMVVSADYQVVPRGPRFEVDPERVAEAVTKRTKVVFLASPNNPTGNATPRPVVERLLGLGLIVVVDEAYHEFCGQTAAGLLQEGAENLIVLRTFSKWAGLAGLRLGYGLFPRALIPIAQSLKSPYSVSQAAEVAGLASLDDLAYLRSLVKRIVTERERLRIGLEAVRYLSPYPSDANFLLCEVIGRSAADVERALAQRAILVRRYQSPRLDTCLRISVGRPDQTDRLLSILQEI